MASASSSSHGLSMDWNDSHRLFIQSMLSHHILLESKAIAIQEKVCELAEVPLTDFAAFVGLINHRINEFDFALRRSHHQHNGEPVLALINTKQDDMARMATNYDPTQIAYLRKLIEMIVMADDEEFAVRSLVAIPLGPRTATSLTSKSTEDLLDQLVKDGWIMEMGGAYTMTTRTILELTDYLHEQYGDAIKECSLCSDLIIMGERCENGSCNVRLHHHCAQQLFVVNKQSLTCPTCSTAWSRLNTFGLGAS
ncbi:Nse1 non-SMC component of SMC5-6 complex-domain-containing protein [Halteromyces radiatus]|uniref:Nse1 non-SMC component of SMC5-6 complex-domain-containing protein n=1 Tax=Halteromyces radiatus TaxID=101107 RepID=UPI0022210636|nr:Nse1 non-SMC component of SMC5-6 complex-domain-containing protein [Halteromyces radiatus]KAI8084789.1 Nse1 non-SMC component of SMC5-6 complex-domain-containing protein [Halteromyces radiatus]